MKIERGERSTVVEAALTGQHLTIEQIMEATGLQKKAARNAVVNLRFHGLVIAVDPGKQGTAYRLTTPLERAQGASATLTPCLLQKLWCRVVHHDQEAIAA